MTEGDMFLQDVKWSAINCVAFVEWNEKSLTSNFTVAVKTRMHYLPWGDLNKWPSPYIYNWSNVYSKLEPLFIYWFLSSCSGNCKQLQTNWMWRG